MGTPAYPEEDFLPPQNKMLSIPAGEGVKFAEIFIDRSFESDRAPTRKPGTAMLTRYLAGGVDLGSSFVIGDRLTDIELAKTSAAGPFISVTGRTGRLRSAPATGRR